MPTPLRDLLEAETPLDADWARLAAVLLWFLIAWVVARFAGRAAAWLIRWQDRRHRPLDDTIDPRLGAHLKRRETLVAVVRTGIAGVAFFGALVLSVAQFIGGVDRLATLAGASFLLLLLGFAFQRVLIDVIAGGFMFLERWYSVGDTVVLAPFDLQGVVEDMSLRRTKLRALNGEVISVHNSQIAGVRVLPHGVKHHAVELFVYDEEDGVALVNAVDQIVPVSPTCFLRRPEIEEIERLGEDLVRIRVKCAVAPGREWLVEGFFLDLLKERAEESLIVHGPVAFAVDESASRSFARAAVGTRVARTPGAQKTSKASKASSGREREALPARVESW